MQTAPNPTETHRKRATQTGAHRTALVGLASTSVTMARERVTRTAVVARRVAGEAVFRDPAFACVPTFHRQGSMWQSANATTTCPSACVSAWPCSCPYGHLCCPSAHPRALYSCRVCACVVWVSHGRDWRMWGGDAFPLRSCPCPRQHTRWRAALLRLAGKVLKHETAGRGSLGHVQLL